MAFPEGHKGLSGLTPGKDGKLPKSEPAKPKAGPVNGDGVKHESVGEHSELHDNGDGSYKTVKGGAEEQHPDMGHALMAIAAHHKPEGKHVHAHHDGHSVHSHGISGGMHDGPNEHATGDEAGQHMGNYLSDEGSGSQEQPAEAQDHEGLTGFGG